MNKKILLIIDNQEGFKTNEFTKEISKNISSLTNSKIFDVKIATKYFNDLNCENNLFLKLQGWFKLLDEKEIMYSQDMEYDYSVSKTVYSAINDEMMDLLFKVNGNEKPQIVFVCGMDSECCVLKTCIDLFENGIIPIFLNKYIASNSGYESHERGLKLFQRLVSDKAVYPKIIDSSEVLNKFINEIEKMVEINKENARKIKKNFIF